MTIAAPVAASGLRRAARGNEMERVDTVGNRNCTKPTACRSPSSRAYVLPAQYFRAHPENGCLKIGLPFGVPRVIDLGKQCYIAVESKCFVNRARDNLRLL